MAPNLHRVHHRHGLSRVPDQMIVVNGCFTVGSGEVLPGVFSRIQDAPFAGQRRAVMRSRAPAPRRRPCDASSWRSTGLATIPMLDPCVDSECRYCEDLFPMPNWRWISGSSHLPGEPRMPSCCTSHSGRSPLYAGRPPERPAFAMEIVLSTERAFLTGQQPPR